VRTDGGGGAAAQSKEVPSAAKLTPGADTAAAEVRFTDSSGEEHLFAVNKSRGFSAKLSHTVGELNASANWFDVNTETGRMEWNNSSCTVPNVAQLQADIKRLLFDFEDLHSSMRFESPVKVHLPELCDHTRISTLMYQNLFKVAKIPFTGGTVTTADGTVWTYTRTTKLSAHRNRGELDELSDTLSSSGGVRASWGADQYAGTVYNCERGYLELNVLTATKDETENNLAFGKADLRDLRRWKDGRLEHKLDEKYSDGGVGAVMKKIKVNAVGTAMTTRFDISPDKILEPPIEKASFAIAAGLNFTLRGNGVLAAYVVTEDSGSFSFTPAPQCREAMAVAGLGDRIVVQDGGATVVGPDDAKVTVAGSVPPHLIVWCALYEKLFLENARIIRAWRQASLKPLPASRVDDGLLCAEALAVWQVPARSERFTECVITGAGWYPIHKRVYVESHSEVRDVVVSQRLDIVLVSTWPNGDRRWHEFSVGQAWDSNKKEYAGQLYRDGEALGCGHLIGWATEAQMQAAGFEYPSLLLSTLRKAGCE
jgi:hypothetical protein